MERKQNKALAILLTALIVLVGAVVWGVVYSFGWFIALIAFLIVYLAMMVYDKFANLTMPVYIVTCIAVVVCNVIASFVAVAIQVESMTDGAIKFTQALQIMFTNPSILVETGFITNIILCIAFSILGVVGFKQYYKQKKLKEIAQMGTQETTAVADTTGSDTTTVADKNSEAETSTKENTTEEK